MAALPARIKVGPFVYRVASDATCLLGEDPDTFGLTRHKELQIVIRPGLALGSQQETLWHEVKHALCRTVGVMEDTGHREEAWVEALSPMELAVLRENPALVAFLLEADDAEAGEPHDAA